MIPKKGIMNAILGEKLAKKKPMNATTEPAITTFLQLYMFIRAAANGAVMGMVGRKYVDSVSKWEEVEEEVMQVYKLGILRCCVLAK